MLLLIKAKMDLFWILTKKLIMKFCFISSMKMCKWPWTNCLNLKLQPKTNKWLVWVHRYYTECTLRKWPLCGPELGHTAPRGPNLLWRCRNDFTRSSFSCLRWDTLNLHINLKFHLSPKEQNLHILPTPPFFSRSSFEIAMKKYIHLACVYH